MKHAKHSWLLFCRLLYLLTVLVICQRQYGQEYRESGSNLLREIDEIVDQHFYRNDFDLEQWRRSTQGLRQAILHSDSADAFDVAINRLLETLQSSHTHYYGRNSAEHFQLLGVFAAVFDDLPDARFQYEGIGIHVAAHAPFHRVLSVYDGYPAAAAGLRYGDQILEVDGEPFRLLDSFEGKAGQSVELQLLRNSAPLKLEVTVVRLDGRTMFEEALSRSIRVIEHGGCRIGYIHAWSYAGSRYQELIREALLWGALKDCDAAILDLRDGWGGADLNYLNLFREPIANISTASRTEPARNFSGVWSRPIDLLVNGRTTSGKELLAYGFKKLQLGQVVGETTAGAVLGGRPFLLSDGGLLYLAVQDVRVDGIRLEGQGVTPELQLPRTTDAVDNQLDAAVDNMAKKLSALP